MSWSSFPVPALFPLVSTNEDTNVANCCFR